MAQIPIRCSSGWPRLAMTDACSAAASAASTAYANAWSQEKTHQARARRRAGGWRPPPQQQHSAACSRL